MIGSHSELACFSFHPRKVLTTGDGGMITTSRSDYYERLKKLRQHGMSVNDRVRHESKKVIFEVQRLRGHRSRGKPESKNTLKPVHRCAMTN